jgi:Arm domain-containing DNA-binding protein
VRDQELAGFFVLIGKRRKRFMVQGEFWRDGVREFALQMKLGAFGDVSTRKARTKAKDALGLIARGPRLLRDHLRNQQQRISDVIVGTVQGKQHHLISCLTGRRKGNTRVQIGGRQQAWTGQRRPIDRSSRVGRDEVPPRCFRDHAEIKEQSDKPC